MTGELLRELRLDKPLKQNELAALLNIDRSMLSKYERGISIIPLDIAAKCARIFNVSLDYLGEITRNRNNIDTISTTFTTETGDISLSEIVTLLSSISIEKRSLILKELNMLWQLEKYEDINK